jgi:hypothetical protein
LNGTTPNIIHVQDAVFMRHASLISGETRVVAYISDPCGSPLAGHKRPEMIPEKAAFCLWLPYLYPGMTAILSLTALRVPGMTAILPLAAYVPHEDCGNSTFDCQGFP